MMHSCITNTRTGRLCYQGSDIQQDIQITLMMEYEEDMQLIADLLERVCHSAVITIIKAYSEEKRRRF